MNNHWLTLSRYLFSMTIAATIVPVVCYSHDITVWRIGATVGIELAAGVILTFLDLAIVRAITE